VEKEKLIVAVVVALEKEIAEIVVALVIPVGRCNVQDKCGCKALLIHLLEDITKQNIIPKL